MPVYLGIDHGTRRVGIAVSDPEAAFAFALETHVEGRDGSVLEHLARLVRERGAESVIVGLPLTADGREGTSAVRARRFAERLQSALPVPVELWDERYTSREADRFLQPRRGRGQAERGKYERGKCERGKCERDKGERDAVAAELILQGWLDHRTAARRAAAAPGEAGDGA